MQNDSKLLSVKWENGMINQPASFLAKVLFFSHQRLRGGLDGRSHGAQVQPEMQSGVHDQILRHHCVVIHMAIRQLHGTLIYSYLTCCSYVIIQYTTVYCSCSDFHSLQSLQNVAKFIYWILWHVNRKPNGKPFGL